MSIRFGSTGRGNKAFYQLTREPMLMIGVGLLFALLILFIIYPLFSAGRMSIAPDGKLTGEVYSYIFTHSRYLRSIRNSVLLGVIVATTSTFTGFVFAYTLTKTKLKLKKMFQWMAILPMISPPFMFALSVILLFGRNGLITAQLLHLDTSGIYGLK